MSLVRARSVFGRCTATAFILVASVTVAVVPATARAQDGPIVVERAEGRATYTEDQTQRDVRDRAVQVAMREAIGFSLGRQISGMTEFVRQENKDALSEQFTEIVRDASHGVVTRHEILEEGWEGPPLTAGSSYRVAIRATVRHDPRATPASFTLQARLNQSELRVRATEDTSDELILTVTTSADVHLTVFHLAADTAQVLFPNQFIPQLRARANEDTEVPAAYMRRDAGLRLRASLPAGLDRRSERLMVVATSRYLPYAGSASRRGNDRSEVPTIRAELDAVVGWILAIPPSERAVVDVPFLIVRDR